MEVTQGGPLSYDLTVPDKDPSAQRGVLFGLAALVAGWLVAVIGGWFALGFMAKPFLVVRGFPLTYVAVCVLAAAWGARRSIRKAQRTAIVAVLAMSLGAGFMAYNTLRNVKPTIPQLKYELDRQTPPGFSVTAEETHGDRLCRQGCPSVQRVYAAPADDPDPVRTFVLRLFANGWEPTSDVDPAMATTARRGSIFVHLGETSPHVVELSATRN